MMRSTCAICGAPPDPFNWRIELSAEDVLRGVPLRRVRAHPVELRYQCGHTLSDVLRYQRARYLERRAAHCFLESPQRKLGVAFMLAGHGPPELPAET